MSTVDLTSVPVGPIVLHIYQFPRDIPSPAPVRALYLNKKKPTISMKTDLLEYKNKYIGAATLDKTTWNKC